MKTILSIIKKTFAIIIVTVTLTEFYKTPISSAVFLSVLMVALFNATLSVYQKKCEDLKFLFWIAVYVSVSVIAYIFSIYNIAICILLFLMLFEGGYFKKIRLYYLKAKNETIESEIRRRNRSKIIMKKKKEKARRSAQHKEAQCILDELSSRREIYVYKNF